MPKTKEEKLATARAWKERNLERVRASRKAYYQANKDRELLAARKWRETHPEWMITVKHDLDAIYREANKEKLTAQRRENRSKRNAKQRNRYKNDVVYAIEKRLRASLNQALRKADTRKITTTFNLIGCSPQYLKLYLESLFLPGMSWERGNEIEIDHIKPVASFNLTDLEQQRQCFHYTNLQPLWKSDNRKKGSKINTVL